MATTSGLSSFFSESFVSTWIIPLAVVPAVVIVVFLGLGNSKKNTIPENESQQNTGQENKALVATLDERNRELGDKLQLTKTELEEKKEELQLTKTELEEQRKDLEDKLQCVNNEMQENKTRLQSVETQIREGGNMSEQTELLREKEHLIQADKNHNKLKQIYKGEILNRNKLLDSIKTVLD